MPELFNLPKAVPLSSTGALLSGAKLYFYEAGTTDLQNVYTDSALSVAHANPVEADGNGVFAPIYMDETLSYKVTLNTSADVLVYTVDNITSALSASEVGKALYPQTSSESSLSITPTDYTYPEGDIRRYGASVSDTDNTTAIQNAINVAATSRVKVKVPGGRWRHASTLYCYYDATNNPNFPSGANQDGRIVIEGFGAPNKVNFINTEYVGSILDYTGSTGVGLDVYDSSGTESRAVVLRDFGLYGNTSGFVLQMHYSPQNTIIDNLFIGNNGNGGCWSIEDVWAASFSDVWCYGNGSGSVVKYNPVEAGGGDVIWKNVNAENGDIGFDFGDAYDGARTGFIKNHILIGCQGKDCRVNYRYRAGVGALTMIDCWAEGSSGATGGAIKLSDMAGWMDGSYANPGLIKIIGGNLSWTDTTAGHIGIEIGDDTGTETTDGVGNISIDGVVMGQIGTNTDAIRIHNSTNAGYRDIRNPVFHNNGGQFIVIDDEAQYGPIFLSNIEADGNAEANWVEETGGSDVSHWIARADNLMPTLSAGTYNYSNAKYVPTMFCNTTGGAITINLPTAPAEHSFALFQADSNANDVTIDPQLLNINGATTDLVFGTNYGAVQIGYDTGRGFVAAGMPKAVDQAAHIADPSGGATIDAEARTAIDAILVVLENLELTASS